jgi:pilus assembly protein CpaE
MYIQLSCIVVEADPANRQEMVHFLIGHGVHVVAQLPASDQLGPILSRSDAPHMVVVNLDPLPHETLKKLAPLVRQHQTVSFFALSEVVDSNLLMDAMQVGVRQFVPLPINEERFVAGLEHVASLHGMGKRARVIHVIPTMGGCGSSMIACNVAASLAKSRKTVLLDLDLVCGTVATSFDIRPRYTISDLMDSAEKLDRNLLANALAVHSASGLAILARPEQPEDTQRIHLPGWDRLLDVLSRVYDYVVIDSVMSIDPLYSATIQAADLNVLVVQLNVPSIRNAERFVGVLRRMGVDMAKVKVIVNRFVKKGRDIEPEEVEKALGMKISWLIPNDFRNAIAAINYGEPVVLRTPRAEISTSLSSLAGSLNGSAE